jgi:hypothetical protein
MARLKSSGEALDISIRLAKFMADPRSGVIIEEISSSVKEYNFQNEVSQDDF